MSLTAAQQKAINAHGNVLMVAGAGTGKTRTLVERCLACLLDPSSPVNIDELLIVTFTEAAAAEMRQRIRSELEKSLLTKPSDGHLQEQLALFDTAFIGTLHSFCFQLVRQHFYELQLDPQLAVIAEEEAPLLAHEVLDQVLEGYYNGHGPEADAVRELLMAQVRGSDQPVRALILRLHRFTQTLPDPRAWFAAQASMFSDAMPVRWNEWFSRALAGWRDHWLPRLCQAVDNPVAVCCAGALAQLAPSCSRAEQAQTLARIMDALSQCAWGRKKDWVEPFKEFFQQAQFLHSLADSTQGDPLAEDWQWVRGNMGTLLKLAREFSDTFTESKRELGLVDFNDLEQCALKLLWDPVTQKPSRVAEHWRTKLRFVLVDEYQDINAAQDKIIECLSREGPSANRFLVGDVKQSIYRFRLANPYIFQEYVTSWNQVGTVIPLVDNFRSREGIISFVNSLFPLVMRRELGGVIYDEMAMLQFGGRTQRQPLSLQAANGPCVELQLRLKNSAVPEQEKPDEAGGTASALQVQDLEEADKEARMVALRLKELFESALQVWDDSSQDFRSVRWSDMAVLLRAPAGKSQRFAREFAKLDVPLAVARSEFYRSLEITDMLSVLQILDNPLQDVPLLAVLHSPVVGLTFEELAAIRLSAKGRFWNALLHWHRKGLAALPGSLSSAYAKVDAFLGRCRRWRRMAREISLCRCLDVLLAETDYAAWLLTQPRGEQRQANLQRFLGLAGKFDRFKRQSLFRFLRFIEAQQDAETEPEVGSTIERDAVRLMSIHQSKGLQFPVVVVADLAKRFNTDDLSSEIILDEEYGLCPTVKAPQTNKRYPSLPHWLASQRQKRELLGEELRLLYVALTRARDHLVLTGSISKKQHENLRAGHADTDSGHAASYWDWVHHWVNLNFDPSQRARDEGRNPYFLWRLREDHELVSAAPNLETADANPAYDRALEQRLSELRAWRYPFAAATKVPAKSSVTSLRRRAAAILEPCELAPFVLRPPWTAPHLRAGSTKQKSTSQRKPSSAEVGNAHHTFLELVDLERVGTREALQAEAARLSDTGALAPEAALLLDFEALEAFWCSKLGQTVRAHGSCVRRELAFTARLSAVEVARFTGEKPEPGLESEFIVMQGVADLVVLLRDEIRVVDFKTDALRPGELSGKTTLYAPQLKVYACALARIYRRPVSECWLHFLHVRQSVQIGMVDLRCET